MKIRIFLATTEGPVQIERITRERIGNSLVCVKRTNRILPISASYDAFVKLGSGVIEREFGPFEPGAFRLDVSGEIADGDSWQLGVFVAHALDAHGRLAGPDDEAAATVWLTGEVDHDLNVAAVQFVPRKLSASGDEFARQVDRGHPVWVFVHTANLSAAGSVPDGVDVVGVETTHKVLETLGRAGGVIGDGAVQGARGFGPPSLQRASADTRAPRARKTWPTVAVALAVLIAFAAAVVWYPRLQQQFAASRTVEREVGRSPPPPPEAGATGAPDETTQATSVAKTEPASSPEDVSPEPEAPAPTEDRAAAEAPRDVAGAEEVATAAEPAAPAGAIEIGLFERRAPEGHTCAAVHFGTAEAELVPVLRQETGGFATSRHSGVCGLQFAVEAFGAPRYVAVFLEISSGRYLKADRLPASLSGNVRLEDRETWSIDLPYRMKKPLEYRFVAVAADQPATDAAEWLSSQPDWDSATAELASRKLEVVAARHRVIP